MAPTSALPLRVEAERKKGAGLKADRKAFIDLPYRLYAGHPTWVAPLRMAERDQMNRAKNPFFDHAFVEHFLARRGDRVVGRIAAIENHLHNEIHEDRIGFFGFFDVEPDAEAAADLLDAARAWLEARGLGPMRGPASYSMNDPCGLLVEGFDESPRILMPYNRPDYEQLLLDAGLVPVKDLVTYVLKQGMSVPERFRRVVDRRLARSGVVLRSLDMADFKREVQVIKELYNRCWEKNWGFVKATSAEFDHAAADLKKLVEPHMTAIAMRDGEPVGFSIFIKDLNLLLKGHSGRLTPSLLWRLLTGMSKIRHTRCVLLGVVPEARGSAINEALFIRAIEESLNGNILDAEAGWILADNDPMRRPIEAVGAKVNKRYRMFETR